METRNPQVQRIPASGTACGSIETLLAGSNFTNPSRASNSSDIALFHFGVANSAPGLYLLCWGPNPNASWAQKHFDLRGVSSWPDNSLRRQGDYPFEIGTLALQGPSLDQKFTCTLGVRCDLDLKGYAIPRGVLLPVAGNCVDRIPAQMNESRIRLESFNGSARLFLDQVEVRFGDAGDLVCLILEPQTFQVSGQLQYFERSDLSSNFTRRLARSPAGSLMLFASRGFSLKDLPKRLQDFLQSVGAGVKVFETSAKNYVLATIKDVSAIGQSSSETLAKLEVVVPAPATARESPSLGTLRNSPGTFRLCWRAEQSAHFVEVGKVKTTWLVDTCKLY